MVALEIGTDDYITKPFHVREVLARVGPVLRRDRAGSLLARTNDAEWSPIDRTIDNRIARLRRNIERDPSTPVLIKIVRGIGYTFTADIETS